MNRRRIAAVVVAVSLLLGGFAVAKWQSSKRQRRAAVQKRMSHRAKVKHLRKKRKGKARKKGKGKGKRKAGKRTRDADKIAKVSAPIEVGPAREAVIGEHTNVVLIIGCTLRADQLTPYGAPAEVTPHLQSRAEAGTVFSSAVTAAPWTKVGASAIVSGYHPAQIGMVEPLERPSRRKLPDEVTTLAERLHDAGYVTFGATANPNLNEVFGFSQGFDDYLEGTELWRLGGRTKVNGRNLLVRSMPKVAEVLEDGKPFYGQFLFTDTHSPSTVKPPEIARFEAPGVPPRVRSYRAMARRFDLAVQVLESSLAHQGITAENTVFLVVSDHGEGLNHPSFHGRGHGNFTYPSTVRMPWVVWGRGVAEGHAISGMASQVDILPTVLGLVGVDGYEGPGESWAGAVQGESDHTTRELAFVDTWFQEARRSGVYAEDIHCHDDWNAVQNEHGERRVPRACYDQDETPEAVTGERADALLTELDAFRSRMESAYAAYAYTQDAEPPDDVKAELEALGYVAGGEGAPE